MKAINTKVKKMLASVIFLLPLAAVIALGGKNVQKIENNVQTLSTYAVTMSEMHSCIEHNKTQITGISIKNEERYDKLILLLQTQNDTMKEMRTDISTMRDDIAELKVDIARLQ